MMRHSGVSVASGSGATHQVYDVAGVEDPEAFDAPGQRLYGVAASDAPGGQLLTRRRNVVAGDLQPDFRLAELIGAIYARISR
jgi:hypothetical protein